MCKSRYAIGSNPAFIENPTGFWVFLERTLQSCAARPTTMFSQFCAATIPAPMGAVFRFKVRLREKSS